MDMVSNDPWGGSPYQYGTWASIPGYGWSWVPGTVWAPAWVTWSYSNNYVGWAPLPPTVGFGVSGYAGRPIVVSQAQYVFVPTNRFVGRNVASVRIPAQQSAEIFRHTKHVTGFSVSGGIVRNTALPMQTIERAAGGKIETRGIQAAGTAPRAVPAGTAHLAVVAPAREVRAARQQAASRSPESSREQTHAQAPADRQSVSAKAPKTHEKPPMESHRQAAEAPAAHHQKPPSSKAQAARPAGHVSQPGPQSGKEKQVEKDKKPDGGNPEERALGEYPANACL